MITNAIRDIPSPSGEAYASIIGLSPMRGPNFLRKNVIVGSDDPAPEIRLGCSPFFGPLEMGVE